MAYNAKNANEIKPIPAGELCQGIITQIQDGKAKDFINEKALDKFDNPEANCINLIMEVKYQDRIMSVEQMLTYIEIDGKTSFTKKSNLGKWFAKYGKLPEVGDKIVLMSNAGGYFRPIF